MLLDTVRHGRCVSLTCGKHPWPVTVDRSQNCVLDLTGGGHHRCDLSCALHIINCSCMPKIPMVASWQLLLTTQTWTSSPPPLERPLPPNPCCNSLPQEPAIPKLGLPSQARFECLTPVIAVEPSAHDVRGLLLVALLATDALRLRRHVPLATRKDKG
jgi:hypothetical protein